MTECEVLGVCGLYCGACNHYRAFLPGGEHLLEKARLQGKELEPCEGCRSTFLTSSCSKCTLRSCAEDRGVLHCGLCNEYPCNQLKAFQHDGRIHHLPILDNLEYLKQLKPDSWLDEQVQRWQCQCGSPFSWYEERCSQCDAPVASYSIQ